MAVILRLFLSRLWDYEKHLEGPGYPFKDTYDHVARPIFTVIFKKIYCVVPFTEIISFSTIKSLKTAKLYAIRYPKSCQQLRDFNISGFPETRTNLAETCSVFIYVNRLN